MEIIYSSKFEREYRRLSSDLKLSAKKKEKIFRKNPFYPSLNTHKLSGKLDDLWSFSVDYRTRIVFEFSKKDIVFFLSVGNHDIYK